ncbi:hypothetical protein RvY_14724 [Ramazzottius varieornatus]|uniref:Zinc finger protein 593 homolog n=1 Tax=Ramazzottius varieornatus TaxID=947166 RepID=A0A1D1VSF2_RAMVA|nr:hypothetical protein RvY_14724 [Ramazzottius varieornatus]
MGQPTRRKHFHRGNARETKANKGRAATRTKALDQIYEELKLQSTNTFKKPLPINVELPGEGQHYCVECARYFVDGTTLKAHQTSKVHKQRARELKKNVPFSQKEAEAAGGMGSYVAPKHFDTDATSSNVSVTTDMEIMSITSP